MTPLTELIVIALCILGNVCAVIYLVISFRTDSRYIKRKERIAVSKYKIALIKRLKKLNYNFGDVLNDISFVVSMENSEARINRYNDVVARRYAWLWMKTMNLDIINAEEETLSTLTHESTGHIDETLTQEIIP